MAAPITWRNVNTGGDGGGRLLANAANAFGNSTNTLLNVLQDQQRQAQAADKQITESNTQDYADKVVQLTGGDPTKLADPDVQANVEKLRLSYGNNIDREKARQYVPQLLAQAQQSQLNTLKFNDAQREEQQRPILDQAYQAIRDNNQEAFKKITAENIIPNENRLDEAWNRARDDEQQRQYRTNAEGRAVRGEARAEEDQGFQRGANARSIQAFNASMADRKEAAANREEDRGYAQRDRELKQGLDFTATVAKNAELQYNQIEKPMGAKTPDPIGDTNKLMKGLNVDSWFGTDEGNRTRATKRIQDVLTNGINYRDSDGKDQHVDVSPDFVQQGLNVIGNNTNVKAGGMIKDLVPYLKKVMEDNPELQRKAKIANAAKAQYNEFLQNLGKAQTAIKARSYEGNDIVKSLNAYGTGKKPFDDSYQP